MTKSTQSSFNLKSSSSSSFSSSFSSSSSSSSSFSSSSSSSSSKKEPKKAVDYGPRNGEGYPYTKEGLLSHDILHQNVKDGAEHTVGVGDDHLCQNLCHPHSVWAPDALKVVLQKEEPHPAKADIKERTYYS